MWFYLADNRRKHICHAEFLILDKVHTHAEDQDRADEGEIGNGGICHDRCNQSCQQRDRTLEQRVFGIACFFGVKNLLNTVPAILLADEPTGALDQTSGKEVLKLFRELNDMGNTIVMITHDLGVAQSAKRIVRIVDGQLYE